MASNPEVSPEQLAEWKQLAREATPGPWIAQSDLALHAGALHPDGDILVWNTTDDDGYGRFTAADLAFIAAARTAIPLLVSEVERLRALLAKQT